MIREIVMPKLGLTMSEGLVYKWHVSVGDEVKVGDILSSIETDKLTNDIESDVEGTVRALLVKEGDTVPVKQVIAIIGAIDDDISAYSTASTDEVATTSIISSKAENTEITKKQGEYTLATPYAKKIANQRGISLKGVVGTGYSQVVVARDVENSQAEKLKITGTAKNYAEKHGINPMLLEKKARIKKDDVIQHLAQNIDELKELVPASNTRKIIAKRMLENWQTSPMVTFDIDINMDEVIAMRKKLNTQYKKDNIRITYNHIVIMVLSQLLLKHRLLNAYNSDDQIELHNYVNMGLAVATDSSLVVPNLKRSEQLSLYEISVSVEDLITRARSNKLELSEMENGTFTVTNLGMYGLKSFTPIINKPEVAIMGISAIRDEFTFVNEEIQMTKVCTFSLTADHAIVDGAVAGAFLKEFKQYMENPYLLL